MHHTAIVIAVLAVATTCLVGCTQGSNDGSSGESTDDSQPVVAQEMQGSPLSDEQITGFQEQLRQASQPALDKELGSVTGPGLRTPEDDSQGEDELKVAVHLVETTDEYSMVTWSMNSIDGVPRVVSDGVLLRWNMSFTEKTGSRAPSGSKTSPRPMLVAMDDPTQQTRAMPLMRHLKGTPGASDSGAECLCTTIPRRIGVEPHVLTSYFPAIAEGSDTVNLFVPKIGTIENLPVTRVDSISAPSVETTAESEMSAVYPQRTFRVGPMYASRHGMVGAVHGVRRLENSTVVYLSFTTSDQNSEPFEYKDGMNSSHASPYEYRSGITNRNDFGGIKLITPTDRHVFSTLFEPGLGSKNMFASKLKTERLEAPEGQSAKESQAIQKPLLYSHEKNGVVHDVWLFKAQFPALPEGTDTVDLDVTGAGHMVLGVKVEDGPLTPETELRIKTMNDVDRFDAPVRLRDGAWPAVVPAARISQIDEDNRGYLKDTWEVVSHVISLDDSASTKQFRQRTAVTLNTDVTFEHDSAALLPKANNALDQVARAISKAKNNPTITIDGHTDDTGENTYNQTLSEKRAQAVSDALKTRGVTNTLTVTGHGETQPLVENDSEANKALNRRVTITIPND